MAHGNRKTFVLSVKSYLLAGFIDRACYAYEVFAIREGQLTMMHRDFSREEADEIITYVVMRLYDSNAVNA